MFTRMLDNVVEINGLPLEQQRERDHVQAPPRHGLPRPGLHPDHAEAALRLARGASRSPRKSRARWPGRLGSGAGAGQGKRPRTDPDAGLTPSPATCCASARRWPPTARRSATSIPGRVLHAKYSAATCSASPEVAPELVDKLAETGARFTHHTSIAPTGTISLSLANNASNGIEPSLRAQLLAQRDPRRQEVQGKGRGAQLTSCWPTAR